MVNVRSTIIVLASILVFALGSSTGARAGGQDHAYDPCGLLTPEQIGAALGVHVDDGEHATMSGDLCLWEPAGWKGSDLADKRVELKVITVDAFSIGKSTPARGITKTPLHGLGDDAYYSTTVGKGTALLLKKGDAAFNLKVFGFPLKQTKAKEKTLAEKVLSKL